MKRPLAALSAAFATIGLLTAIAHTPPSVRLTGIETGYIGTATAVDRYNFSQRVVVRLTGSESGEEVLLYVHSSMPVVEPGDTIRFTTVLRPVNGPDSQIPDLRSALRGAEVYRISAIADVTPASITGNSDDFTVSTPRFPSISIRLYRMRIRFVDLIYKSGISAPAAAFLAAVLVGDSSYLSDETRAVFSRTGTAHMLALSGMHVAVIAFLVSLIFFPLRVLGHRKWAMLLTIPMLWFYAALTGMSPSVVRAVIMASVVLTGRIVHRSSSPLNSLCLAALLILLFDPWQLFSAGFQLSFSAVASILMFSSVILPDIRMWSFVRQALGWLVVSVSAVIGTGAISAWYFHQIPLLFIIANIPAAFMLPILMGGELVNVMMTAAGWNSEVLASLVSALYGWLENIGKALADIDGASLTGIYFSPWLLVPYYLALIMAWIALKLKRMVYSIASVMLFVFFGGAYAITESRPVREEAYVVEYPYSTVIVAFDGENCSLLTDAPATQFDRISNVMQQRLSDFSRHRRGGDIRAVNPVIESNMISADSVLWRFGNLTVAPVGLRRNLHSLVIRPRYALVSARYFGSMRQVVDSLQPDTVALAASITYERRMKYARELDSIRRPYRIGLPVRLL
ncbi:MAG: ComEC/Rec2 family competence protein [Bacteroidales bacterium]|nr:ComEC/Rec2 family competence protein [Bacteroidales bacterium]